MPPQYSGRLELTWTNKDLCLLARENGEYEWVPQSDYRVAEVRLLRNAATVGDVHAAEDRASDNLLVRGDALSALTALGEIPEFAEELVGRIKLAYLDPPFNTQQSFLQYDDALEHSVWLTMMRDRLLQIRRLLSEDGSVWVHCDDYEQAHLRVLMDEVFGRANFVATIVWERQYGQSNIATVSVSHDYLVVYATDRKRWNAVRNRLERTAAQDKLYKNPDDDPRGPWMSGSFDARNYYSKGLYPITTPAGNVIAGPPEGSFWRYSADKLAELDADNRIYWGPNRASAPRIKRFLSEVSGVVPKTWWPHEDAGHTDEAKKEIKRLVPNVEPFATPKPERLMQRVIHIATDPGDIVLDCFLGSATTAAVAHKMGRQWVGIERSSETLDTFALPRLTQVASGQDGGGISEAVGWNGGGGFRVLDVGPSMFENDEGVVVLADWATNSELAEATAAQLGFAHEPAPPFCGRKGRSRLAVIDGLVNELVVNLLVGALAEDELLTVCGTSVDDQATEALRLTRPGSRVRKIPASLLNEYQEATRWNPRTVDPPAKASNGGAHGSQRAIPDPTRLFSPEQQLDAQVERESAP